MAASSPIQTEFYEPDWTVGYALKRVQTLERRKDAGYVFVASDGSERSYTFEEIEAAVINRAKHLLSRGLKKGDRVGIIVPDPEEFVLTFFACAVAGLVSIPLFPPLGMGKLDSYIRDTARILGIGHAKMLITSKQVEPILWSLVGKVDELDQLITTEKFAGDAPADAPDLEEVHPDDLCFLQFTSGSTAAPKGVMVTHRNLGANTQTITEHGLDLSYAPTDVTLSWLPLYHDMGLIGMVLCPLASGLHAVLVPTMTFIKRPACWMELMSKYKATITFAPNFAYGLAVKRTKPEKVAQMELSQVRILGCGAEPNHPGTLRAFAEHFAPAGLKPEAILPVYGMAEATLAMSFNRLDQQLRTDVVDAKVYQDDGRAVSVDGEGLESEDTKSLEFVSCGWALPRHAVTIIDDAGNALADRCIGEIVFSGPSVTPGYFENDEATSKAFKGDSVRTGDLGYLVDGELFVTGRAKDLIILNGRNYDPHSIEWVVADLDGVRKGNVICFSVPGAQTEELVVVAEIKRGEDPEALEAIVRGAVREEFSLNPKAIKLMGPGTLPKTTSGKLQRRKCREQFISGELGGEGVRTMGNKGQAIVLARHVARSMVSRVTHTVKRGFSSTMRAR
ncbi:MAG: fatty acyl-AMP ligase [Myxococcota bacterium]